MEKHGDCTDKSFSDYRDKNGKPTRAKYVEKKGYLVADEAHKNKLRDPETIGGK